MRVIITSPSLDTAHNVSGMAAMTRFIIRHNTACHYQHFALGKRDIEARGVPWFIRTVLTSVEWVCMILKERRAIIHFNLAVEIRSLLRDAPLMLAARLLRRHMIVHIHGGKLLSRCGSSRSLKFLLRMAVGYSAVVVLSRTEQKLVERTFDRGKVFVLPNCIDLDEAMSFQRSSDPNEALTLLFLGRISRDKGIEVIYAALAALRSQGATFRFVLAGSGPEQQQYVPKFAQLLEDDFEFAGVVAGAEKTALLKRCNVFLLPSFFEGMPMALLESMSFGLVPITTAVGSIPAVVRSGRTGILLNTPDPNEIVSAIKSLADDRNYAERLSQNASRHILRHFQASTYCTKLNAIYQYE